MLTLMTCSYTLGDSCRNGRLACALRINFIGTLASKNVKMVNTGDKTEMT